MRIPRSCLEIHGTAVEGDTLFGALPQENKPLESVISTVLGDACLNELDTSSASVVIVIRKGTTRSGACGSICLNTGTPGPDTVRIDRLFALS